jgi:hypothetical protein
MLVYKSQNQCIEDNDVIQVWSEYYVVSYCMPATTFVLYPLGWHTLNKLSFDMLDADEGWTYLGHIKDKEVYEQLPTFQWPYDNQNDNITYYLWQIMP